MSQEELRYEKIVDKIINGKTDESAQNSIFIKLYVYKPKWLQGTSVMHT